MIPTLPINKIYIDSRHKTISSRSDADFEIQLKEPINLPDNCICVISDILIKNLITTIEKFNEHLYVRMNNIDKIIKNSIIEIMMLKILVIILRINLT